MSFSMVRLLFGLEIISLLFLTFSLRAEDHFVIDASGTQVKLKGRAQRIITLMPSLAELVASIAEKEPNRIVGVSEFTDFPESLKKTKKIGSHRKIHFEEIVALKPDLILATLDGNGKDPILHLRELGLPVVVVATDSFARIIESMRLVGSAMGQASEGDQLAKKFDQGLHQIQERAQKRKQNHPTQKVLLEISGSPLIVAGQYSFLHDALNAIGAQNVYSDLQASYPRPSVEDVVSRNPDVIVIFGFSVPEKEIQSMKEEWNRFPSLKAVQAQKIHVLRNEALVRPTLRLLEGLNLLEKTIYETH